jgi:protocatechuate 3,4-dioxygenase beta subunit
MKKSFPSLLLSLTLLTACKGQEQQQPPSPIPGGAFENRELTYQGLPSSLSHYDTSAGWTEGGRKLLLTGTIYQPDGRTPAPGVLLYYYQTNGEGRYLHRPQVARSMPPNALGQTHGYLRGWVKTDSTGRYAIYTIQPGAYPSGDEPAHIHLTVKEPGPLAEYYIDDAVFDDDPLLTTAWRRKREDRGGTGVLRTEEREGLLVGERNIILGLNIPGHPSRPQGGERSGRKIGEEILSFMPYHAWGPDRGTRTCPVCKYGLYQGIFYFVGNRPDWEKIRNWLRFLEEESRRREGRLKVFFVYGKETGYTRAEREKTLSALGMELGLSRVALTFVPSLTDEASEIALNQLNPEVESTLLIYRRSVIIDKFINAEPTEASFEQLRRRLSEKGAGE